MKKLVSLLLVVLMLAALTVPAMAAGSFVNSATNNGTLTIEEGELIDPLDGCKLMLTMYRNRASLGVTQRATAESAFAILSNAKKASDIDANMAKLEGANDFVCMEVFILSCDKGHTGHKELTLTMKYGALANFACLMTYEGAEWDLVSDAKVNGNKLTFTGDPSATYAIFLKNLSPATGDHSNVVTYAIVGVAAAVAIAVCGVVLTKKSRRSEES